MLCYQCQETAKNTGCTIAGVCGKKEQTANLQDLLVYALEGVALYAEKMGKALPKEQGVFILQSLFATITNANFDNDKITVLIKKAVILRELKAQQNMRGFSMLFIAHNIHLARKIADRVCVLDQGFMIEEGTAFESTEDAFLTSHTRQKWSFLQQ